MTGWNDLVPGVRYRVIFNDCCAVGYFEDVFVGPGPDYKDDDDALVFEHARVEQDWGPYEFTEVIEP